MEHEYFLSIDFVTPIPLISLKMKVAWKSPWAMLCIWSRGCLKSFSSIPFPQICNFSTMQFSHTLKHYDWPFSNANIFKHRTAFVIFHHYTSFFFTTKECHKNSYLSHLKKAQSRFNYTFWTYAQGLMQVSYHWRRHSKKVCKFPYCIENKHS